MSSRRSSGNRRGRRSSRHGHAHKTRATQVKAITLRWVAHPKKNWRELTQAMSRGAPPESVTEFVFNLAGGHAPATTDAVRFVVTDAHGSFAVVRHLNFVEHSENAEPLSARRRYSFGDALSPATSPRASLGSTAGTPTPARY